MTTDDVEDEPSEAELADEARIDQALATASTAARRVVEDCHEAFGYGIPTVVLGQVGRWYRSSAGTHNSEQGCDADRAARALAELFESGDDLMQTIIATGFLEALPVPGAEDRAIVERLPGPLREELARMERWEPG